MNRQQSNFWVETLLQHNLADTHHFFLTTRKLPSLSLTVSVFPGHNMMLLKCARSLLITRTDSNISMGAFYGCQQLN